MNPRAAITATLVFLLLLAGGYLFLRKIGIPSPIPDTREMNQRVPIGAIRTVNHFSQPLSLPEKTGEVENIVITLQGATYKRVNPGTITFKVTQGSREKQWKKRASSMKDNRPVNLKLPADKFQPGPATLEIFSEDNSAPEGATFWAFTEDVSDPARLNGIPQDFELVVSYGAWKSRWYILARRMESKITAFALLGVFCALPALMTTRIFCGLEPDKEKA